MKLVTITIIALLSAIGLVFSGTTVYADDPEDDEEENSGGLVVEVEIVGDEADVIVDVQGEGAIVGVNVSGSTVSVNGDGLVNAANLSAAVGAATQGTAADEFVYQAARRADKWINNVGNPYLGLLSDGLAKLILVTVENEQDYKAGLENVEGVTSYNTKNIATLGNRLQTIEEANGDQYQQLYNEVASLRQLLVIMGAVLGLVLVVLGIVGVRRLTH